ncbi:glutaminyl-peptide cyclotransferase-like isoform X2 [Lingula anatina]|uniref:Glutaminyl-peptide cyclotransferase n=1 Tax=Lingula anatina TaxID=7574 RepID=A0A2R2MJN6_LINAN|nr:glutaminyl-peptide cyclotransferase-like isoform X2 [Lingula anatina]|eukprot:XP_023930425.1 glutaminyl-peptide cyclotransferase-like isoform X2 [Lingula anatina]
MKWRTCVSGAILSVCLAVTAYGKLTRAEHWSEKRLKHKHKLLTSERLKRAAGLADIDLFKQELKPFLKVRVSGTPANVEVQEHIKSRMSDLGWQVEEDSFVDTTPYEDKNFNNIIATYNPQARRRLVLACHFDSKYFPKAHFIAATDSAVPCAMMIHLADSLKELLKKGSGDGAKDISLQLIFFDGEEAFKHWTSTDSIYGARHLAAKLENTKFPAESSDNFNTNELHRMDVMVLLDLIGAANPKFHSWFQNTQKLFERLSRIESDLMKEGQIPTHDPYFSKTPLSYNAGIEDDHIPFLRKNVPILHLICYPFPSVWHKPSDDESALDYTTIDNLNKILQVFVIQYLHLKP